MTPEAIIGLLRGYRFPLSPEKAAIAEAFDAAGVAYRREHRLDAGTVPDFLVSGTVVEVKIGGNRRAIFRQLERYARHPEVTAVVLATNIFMGLPPEIIGKPAFLVHLGRAWL